MRAFSHSPRGARHQPRTRFAAGFLGLANFLEGRLDTQGDAIVGEDGRFPVPAGQPGTRVCGLVRPEDIRADQDSGFVRGTVREVVFLGEVARYAIETDSGRSFTANVGGTRKRFTEGSAVWLSWDPDRVWLLPEEGGAPTIC